MGELTEEEKQILELLKRAEERERAEAQRNPRPPSAPPPDRFIGAIGVDPDGSLYPVTQPLPSAEKVKADNLRVIRALQEAEDQAEARAREAARAAATNDDSDAKP